MSAEPNVQPPRLDIPLVDEQHANDATAEKPQRASRVKLLKSRIVTASSNFAVQYNYNDIAWSGKVWIASLYGYPCWAESLSSTIIFVGTLFGMVVLGVVGDVVGRSRGMVLTLSAMAAGAALSAALPFGKSDVAWGVLICCRFLIGVGAGGVYPLAATKAAEDTVSECKQRRSQAAAWGFFWRNPAILWVYLLGLLLSEGVGRGAALVGKCGAAAADADAGTRAGWQAAWRIHLGFGAVPVLVVIWQAAQQVDAPTAVQARERSSLLAMLRRGGFYRQLIATAGGWFFYDFAYYGNTLLQPRVLAAIFGGHKDLAAEASQNCVVALMGVGFTLVAIPLIVPVGTANLQALGFVFNSLVSLVLACVWTSLEAEGRSSAQFSLYALLYGSYWVCNVTTFVLPSETFEPEVRSSLNGLSAAAGKVGAILGTTIFEKLLGSFDDESEGVRAILFLCTAASALGAVVTAAGVGVTLPGCARRRAHTQQRSSVAPLNAAPES